MFDFFDLEFLLKYVEMIDSLDCISQDWYREAYHKISQSFLWDQETFFEVISPKIWRESYRLSLIPIHFFVRLSVYLDPNLSYQVCFFLQNSDSLVLDSSHNVLNLSYWYLSLRCMAWKNLFVYAIITYHYNHLQVHFPSFFIIYYYF